MSTSDPKYQIKIIKAGIGDPMLTLQFQFTNSDGTYDLPSHEHPVYNLDVVATLNWTNSDGEPVASSVGHVEIYKVQTTDTYNLTLPFDMPDGFEMGSAVGMEITMSDNRGTSNIHMYNGTGNMMDVGLTYFEEGAAYGDLYGQYEYQTS